MKVLALMKYDFQAASTRQRLIQFIPNFSKVGVEFTLAPLLSNEYLLSLSAGVVHSRFFALNNYVRRIGILLFSRNYDAVWIHCETFPYLPGLFERLVFLRFKSVIYDFDDAIFHQYDSHRNSAVRWLLGKKLEPLLGGANLAICGNRYLQSYAKRFCLRTEIIPTVVDTSIYVPRAKFSSKKELTIGWIGSPSTWVYVHAFTEMLSELAEEEGLLIKIVGAGPQRVDIPNFKFVRWSEETEVDEIQSMDIGIMPLPDERWARGKCGYKLIQYMACGIPVVASPVGVNTEIVDHGVNGYLATNVKDWKAHLLDLVRNPTLRAEMGASGRRKIETKYSLKHFGPILAQLVKNIGTL